MLTNSLDRLALEDAWRTHHRSAFAVARAITRCPAVAEDCISDAFLDVLQRAEHAKNLESLFVQAARNRAIEWVRVNRRQAPLDDYSGDPSHLQDAILDDILKEAYRRDGPSYRYCITMLDCGGSITTTAQAVNVTPQAVSACLRTLGSALGGQRGRMRFPKRTPKPVAKRAPAGRRYGRRSKVVFVGPFVDTVALAQAAQLDALKRYWESQS